MHADIILTAAGVAIYGAASVIAVLGLLKREQARETLVGILVSIGALILAVVLVIHGFRYSEFPVYTRFGALSTSTLTATVVYLVLLLRGRARGLSALLVPLLTVLLLAGASATTAPPPIPTAVRTLWLRIHAVCALGGYGMFILAAVLAVGYLAQHRNLKLKRDMARLPALETLERLMTRQIQIGFVLLTLAIVIGAAMVRRAGGGPEWITDPKVLATLTTWTVYASLIHLRAGVSRHGRSLAIISLIGFACVCFAIIGVHLVTKTVHSQSFIKQQEAKP